MTARTVLVRTATAAATGTVAALAAVLPAAPATAAIPVLARVNLTMAPVSATASRICWDGFVDNAPFLAGVWLVSVDGVRSTGSVIAMPAYTATGPSLPYGCYTVSNGGAPTGALSASVSLTGAGADVTALCHLTATWTSATSAPQPVVMTCTDTAFAE